MNNAAHDFLEAHKHVKTAAQSCESALKNPDIPAEKRAKIYSTLSNLSLSLAELEELCHAAATEKWS